MSDLIGECVVTRLEDFREARLTQRVLGGVAWSPCSHPM